MELADWADLFIMSLWRHVCSFSVIYLIIHLLLLLNFTLSNKKWHVNELDQRIPEIQGFLELAVQRSSCEGDPNKDRLYVYLNGDCTRHFSASAIGKFCISDNVLEANGVWQGIPHVMARGICPYEFSYLI